MVASRGVLVGAGALALAGISSAARDGDLAQQAQSPIAGLISVSFQHNTDAWQPPKIEVVQ